MVNQKRQLILSGLNGPTRLDRAIRNQFPAWGRRAVQSMVNGGQVRVNDRVVWLCSWKVDNGDRLAIMASPPPKPEAPTTFDDAWLIAEEADLIAVNKPAGLLSEKPRRREATNLLDLAQERFGLLHLFHRLDRDTSGVVLLTRSGQINRYLDEAFKANTVKKEYIALVSANNDLPSEGIIEARIGPHPKRRDMMVIVRRGGKRAVTRYRLAETVGDMQRVILWPQTGRTHQLRLHLAHLGAPILGDRLYNPTHKNTSRLMLHARTISLPEDGSFRQRSFTAILPAIFS